MVLVLFFFSLIALIFLLIILTSTLSIQIDIRNFKFYKEENIDKKINKDYEIFIHGYIFKKIKIFKYKINEKKFSKKYFQKMQNKLDFSILKSFFANNFDDFNMKFIEIESLKLSLNLGTENVILTSGIVTFSNIIISIFLSKLIDKYDGEKYSYEVRAIFENKNKIDLFLESKIRIKLFSLIKAFKTYNYTKQKVYTNKNIIGADSMLA